MENFNNYIINIRNLKHNYNVIKEKVGKATKICSMVKADAYGHGIIDVCKALKNSDFFGVANVGEAITIRKFNKETPILIVGVFNHNYTLWCSQNNISVTCTTKPELLDLIDRLKGKPLKIHIKINSGLNRIGVNSIKEFRNMLNIIKKHKNIVLEGVFTHFATKFDDMDYIIKQHNQFCKYLQYIDESKVIVHCCNSFASLMFPCFWHGMVRCGYYLYGWEKEHESTLKPVLSIVSTVVSLHKIKKGDSVGYDRTFVATKNTIVGVVPIGYADGFDRRLSNNFYVMVKGKLVKVIGNVCMDVFMIDLTKVGAKIGDEVIILGGDYEGVSVYDYAQCLGTSPYEIMLKFRYNRFNRILIK